MRGPTKFKKTDVTRAAKAVLAAGLDIARVVIREGEIAVIPGKPTEVAKADACTVEVSEDLKGLL